MRRPAVLAEDAERDIEEATVWYAARGGSELAARFLDALGASLSRLEELPRSHPEVYPGIRRALAAPFPYLLLYGISEHTILVHRCIHARRDPARRRDLRR